MRMGPNSGARPSFSSKMREEMESEFSVFTMGKTTGATDSVRAREIRKRFLLHCCRRGVNPGSFLSAVRRGRGPDFML